MKKIIKKNLFLAALLTVLILPALVFTGSNFASAEDAQAPAAEEQGANNALLKNMSNVGEKAGFQKANSTSVSTIAGSIVNVALSLLGIIFVCFIVYAGYLWMTAQGSEEQVEKAQKIIKNSIIGIIIVVSAWAIYNIISRII